MQPFIMASSLPMLDACPCFESGPPGYAARRGSLQHDKLEKAIKTSVVDLGELKPNERDYVRWAFQWVLENTSDARQSELKVSPVGDDLVAMRNMKFDVIDVTDDVVHVIDYKSGGDHGYKSQMAAYALVSIRLYDRRESKSTLLFARDRQVVSDIYNEQKAQDVVYPIIERVCNPNKEPVECNYCGWCCKCPCLAHEKKFKGDAAVVRRLLGKK